MTTPRSNISATMAAVLAAASLCAATFAFGRPSALGDPRPAAASRSSSAGAKPNKQPPTAASSAASSPATRPALVISYETFLPPDAGDLPARLAEECRRRAIAIAGGGEEGAKAGADILAIQKATLDALGSFAGDGDLEARLRSGEVLEEAALDARVIRMEASLPRDQRTTLRQFRQAQPRIFLELLSPDWGRRVAAAGKLTRKTDPNRLAAPLLAMCLKHPSSELVNAAAEAVERCGYRSDVVIDALCAAMARFQNDPGAVRYSAYQGEVETISPYRAALGAMGSIGGPRAAAAMLDALLNNTRSGPVTSALTDAIVSTGEKRLLPTLIEKLNPSDRSGSLSWSTDGKTGTTLRSDLALWAFLRLSNQSPSRYGMLTMDRNEWGGAMAGSLYVGFANDKDRQAAYAKAKAWWDENRKQPPYAGLEPLPPPARPAPPSQPAMAAAPATAPGTKPALAAASAPNALGPSLLAEDDLGAEASAVARRLAEAFRSPSLPVRDAARRALLDLHAAPLRALAEANGSAASIPDARIMDTLMEAATEAGIQAARFPLPADLRKKLSALLAAQPKHARAAFSLNWSDRVEALNAISAQGDPQALAEPLLLMYLRDSTPQVRDSALKIAAAGNYRGDMVVDALLDALARASDSDWQQLAYAGPKPEGTLAWTLTALEKIKSPRAAPLLVACLVGRNDYHRLTLPRLLPDAIIATGEIRVIPALMDELKDEHMSTTMNIGRKQVHIAACDMPLYIMLKLASQEPAEYQMIVAAESGRTYIGFKDEKARKAGVQKWTEWWNKAKEQPPYKDLQPLGIPGMPGDSPDRADGAREGILR
jgi:hypothetical protein